MQFFYKTVVITKHATLYNQLEDGIDGVVVPINYEKCGRNNETYWES